jgi:type II secretory pathway pseudopilin PulG
MRGQRGLSLVEISLSLALVGLTTAMMARNIERNSQHLLAQAEAQTLSAIQKAMQDYLNAYAMQMVAHPANNIEKTVQISPSSTETYVIDAGHAQGQSFWPTLDQLKQMKLLAPSLNLSSMTASGRHFVTGPVEVYPGSNESTALGSTQTCLRDGCVLRISAYPDTSSEALSATPLAKRSAQLLTQLIRQLGQTALLAHADDGVFLDSQGSPKTITPNQLGRSGDAGVYAEYAIAPVANRKLSDAEACPAGFFGFNAGSRSSTDASEFAATSPTRCVATHGQIPAGQQVVAYDNRSPQTGYVRLVCEVSIASGELTLLAASDAQDPLGPTDYACNP